MPATGCKMPSRKFPQKLVWRFNKARKALPCPDPNRVTPCSRVQASKAVQFKEGGRAELSRCDHYPLRARLHPTSIKSTAPISNTTLSRATLLAKARSRWISKPIPQGLTHPDQAPPKELKNPLHLTTTNLLFNQKTGNASTRDKVEFTVPQANGSAVGLDYVANTAVLVFAFGR